MGCAGKGLLTELRVLKVDLARKVVDGSLGHAVRAVLDRDLLRGRDGAAGGGDDDELWRGRALLEQWVGGLKKHERAQGVYLPRRC